jgi:glycosyltransferase involved in cell wall biosynthesis
VPAPGESQSETSTLIVVPAYNEEVAIAATIGDIRHAAAACHIVVIDDGSSDGTVIAAEHAGARTVRLPFNTGVGGAVRTGLRYALYRGYRRTVVVDADGQHDAAGIHALLGSLDDGADIAIGNRFAMTPDPYRIGWVRRRAMRLLAWVVRRVTGQTFSDVTSGFRAFNRRAIEVFANEFPSEYLADTVEVLLIAYAHGLRVDEVPVRIRTRAGGLPSTRSAQLVLNYLRLLVTVAASRYGRRGRQLRKDAT